SSTVLISLPPGPLWYPEIELRWMAFQCYFSTRVVGFYFTKYSYSHLSFCSLGSIEGNVDKLVVHRMQGRGCCWRSQGAEAMLAILRNKDKLQNHSFHYFPIPPPVKRYRRVKTTKIQQEYKPVSGSISLFHGGDQLKPWVQLLKRKVNDGFSLNAFF
ncbi:MAG: hypothetical protein ACOY16_12695, partial [Chloroflexota bacterium]